MGASSGATAPSDASPDRREILEARPLPVRDRVRSLLLGPPPGEEVTPYVPLAEPTRAAGPLAKWGVFVLCALGGLIGAVLIVASAPVWYLAEPSWRLTVPGIPHPGTSFQATSTFVLGLVFMALAWIGLIGRAERAPISSPGPPRGGGAGRCGLVRPRAARPAAAEPRRLQLRLAGRDGQPGHRPHDRRSLQHAAGALGLGGRPDLARRPGALRAGGGRGRQGRRRAHRARSGLGHLGLPGPRHARRRARRGRASRRSPAR